MHRRAPGSRYSGHNIERLIDDLPRRPRPAPEPEPARVASAAERSRLYSRPLPTEAELEEIELRNGIRA
jgi:hypothetical protein